MVGMAWICGGGDGKAAPDPPGAAYVLHEEQPEAGSPRGCRQRDSD